MRKKVYKQEKWNIAKKKKLPICDFCKKGFTSCIVVGDYHNNYHLECLDKKENREKIIKCMNCNGDIIISKYLALVKDRLNTYNFESVFGKYCHKCLLKKT